MPRKIIPFFVLLLMIIGCRKQDKQAISTEDESPVPPYDTVAVDSFSVGATSKNLIIKKDTLRKDSSLIKKKLPEKTKEIKAKEPEKTAASKAEKKETAKNPKPAPAKENQPKENPPAEQK